MAIFGIGKSQKNTEELTDISQIELPKHVGIIMDGNGRWAKKRGLPRSAGHKAGANNFRTITRYCSDIGIKYLTVYAFSTENWKRPSDEVSALMSLFKSYLNEALTDFKDDSIVVKFIGDKTGFNSELQELIRENEEESANRDGMVLNIAMNYGSRAEITMAVKKIAEKVKSGELSVEDITEQTVSDNLYTAFQPDPDLVIRPSGEYRISNFLLWQSAYTEYVIMDKLWPDFTKEDMNRALLEFANRNRRYGGV
ncbi:MAG TPA: isoprenyl transferase [Candidatus Limousia pullorum]|uniref:Isoprenyl transferase n=1 Tax=Candidatus Limousia pullorum TaxID=2840860 RepID=A0A9D1LYG7_9FIRM|nr:isoprenyl transferase [Anaeromassilibacillus sp. An172]MEE0761529.1 isoprenyl transferase [Acutalibacteraceae bacterium]OUP78961.1 di-trans,poly-cis-decaprenylcistransferase [Anaeromassilibacillus sp. An172]HIU50298.1 isoprenyl transferase [Candidatus Limousia pullorum]